MATRATALPQIRVVEGLNLPSVRRKLRRPRHTFNLSTKPYQLVPFMIAPVLPGETLTNLLMQARVVTDPIQNALIGWWKEYYFFYVPWSSMVAYDATMAASLKAMVMDPDGASITDNQAAADIPTYYTFKGGIKFVQSAVAECIAEYFRDEGEAWDVATLAGYAAARMDQETWLHSIKLASETGDDDELAGVDALEEEFILPSHTSEYAQWEIMRDSGLTDLTYEDFLRSYGVTIPKDEEVSQSADKIRRPELIRFVRKWTYPSNSIDPTDGSAASAVYWSIAERADKKRFFKEPGFICGITCTRPKLYFGSQMGAAVGYLDNVYSWLPAVLQEHVYTSLREIPASATDGILRNNTESLWFDLRDLFVHGDQFVNHTMSAAANHGLAVPGIDLANLRYPTEALVDSLFVSAAAETVREDGVVHLNILGKQTDTTPN